MRDLRELLAANDSFYKAFEAADPGRMDDVWAQTPDDVCIHPGGEVTRGAINVANSWRRLFASGERLRFALGDLHAEVYGDVGVVHAIENIKVGMTNEIVGRAAATNLYRRIDGRWRLVLHHGSPVGGSPEEILVTPGEIEN